MASVKRIIVIEDGDFYAEYTKHGVILSSYRLTPELTAKKYAEKVPGAESRHFFYGIKGIKQPIPTNPQFDGWPSRIDPKVLLTALGLSRKTSAPDAVPCEVSATE